MLRPTEKKLQFRSVHGHGSPGVDLACQDVGVYADDIDAITKQARTTLLCTPL